MARLWTGGAEWNDSTAESLSLDSTTVVTSPVRTGTYAWSAGAGITTRVDFTGTLGVGYYVRIYLRVASLGSSAAEVIFFSGPQYNVLLNTDGTLQLRYNTTAIGSTSSALALDTWYRVELFQKIGSGSGDDSSELRLDGVTIASEANQTRAVGASSSFGFGDGASATGLQVYVDDAALNDDTGANQNTWPGDGKIVLLKPISDNAKGTGWTNDAAGTTNLFQAVDNTPPVGIADTTASTGLHQLRNATSNANVNYDANLTTYTTAGVGASDTVNVVVPMVATGAPVTTSSKQGTFGVSSNPAITNVALSATGTSGAFWAGATAVGYATGWKWSKGTTTYVPSVTLGNSPVARITQVTSSTRIAMVCAMGMYVDYTPAAVAAATFTPVLTMAPRIPTRRS